jgi:hypothetical protein
MYDLSLILGSSQLIGLLSRVYLLIDSSGASCCSTGCLQSLQDQFVRVDPRFVRIVRVGPRVRLLCCRFFIFIFGVLGIIIIGIIIIDSFNPIGIVVDDSVSILVLKAFETLLVCHVFDSFDDDIGHGFLVDNVP